MFNTKEKTERRLGVKLFLKAHRCNSPKCVMIRHGYRPGLHGQGRHVSSEFGQQLNEKQKIKASYGLREVHLRRVFEAALKNPGITGAMMIQLLERRLDNVVFKLGIASSRSVARQLVGHGHIQVNGKNVKASSYLTKVGDKISIRPASKNHQQFSGLGEKFKTFEPEIWLRLDKDKLVGEVVALPKDFDVPFDVNMVVDYYSK